MTEQQEDPYKGAMFTIYKKMLDLCMRNRIATVIAPHRHAGGLDLGLRQSAAVILPTLDHTDFHG